MKMKVIAAVLFVFALGLTSQLQAQLFSPTDAILGGERVGGQFVVGTAGTMGNINNWPAGESPDHAIDGVGQKYLNFGREDTGFIVTPASGSSVVTKLKFWTANDAVERDPASFELWGTNAAVTGSGPFALAGFDLIASGPLALPASRNPGGMNDLNSANSQIVAFSNSDAFTSYLVLFPSVKNGGTANSMQIAEVQANIPEPSTLVLVLVVAGLAVVRLRK
jgi:hypothetical protein